MRGIVSMGMLLALRDLKMLDVFDVFVGVSAGSLNLAYVLAGQGAMGLSVYFDSMTRAENLSLKRVHSTEQPLLDMRRFYTHVLREKELHTAKLQRAYGSKLYVATTNITAGYGELVPAANHRFEEFLIAGATIPVVSGEAWRINNQEYYDGGLTYVDPFLAAKGLDATHTLVLNTRHQGYQVKPTSLAVEYVLRRLRGQRPVAATRYRETLKSFVREYGAVPWGETQVNHMHTYRHAMAHRGQVATVTTEPAKLLHDVKAGYQSVIDLFSPGSEVGIVPTRLQ